MLLPLLPPGSPVSGTRPAPLLHAQSPSASGRLLRQRIPPQVSIPGLLPAPCRSLASVDSSQPRSGERSSSRKGGGGDRRYAEAAGRLSRICVCGNAFSGCLTFSEQKGGAGMGRAGRGQPSSLCSLFWVKKTALLPIDRESCVGTRSRAGRHGSPWPPSQAAARRQTLTLTR